MINWMEIANMDMEELAKVQVWVTEELDRRAAINEKVRKINELLHDLVGDLRGCDVIDYMNSRTGEVLNVFDDDYIGDEIGDWAAPEIHITFNGRE